MLLFHLLIFLQWDLWQKLDRLETLVLGQSRDSENMTEKLAAVETQIKIMYLEGASCPTGKVLAQPH